MVRDWKPRRAGAVYCAPACGGGCTYAEFEAATKKAEALAAEAGPGWEPRVHENLGWHYSAAKGVHQLHKNGYLDRPRYPRYMLFLNCSPQIVTGGDTPQECYEAARKIADGIASAVTTAAGGL